MKKLFSILAVAAAAAMAFVACQKPGVEGNTPDANTLAFTKPNVTLFVGDKETLELQGLNEGERVTYSEDSEKKVVTVSTKGVVTAKAVGTAVVTATSRTDASRKASITVKVIEKEAGYVDVSTIVVLQDGAEPAVPVTIKEGETAQFSARIAPDDATAKEEATKNLAWSVKGTGVISVDANGKVTAIAAGEDYLVASTSYTVGESTKEISKEIRFVVTSSNIPTTGISLSSETLRVTVGNTSDLYVTFEPENHTDQLTVTWESSAPAVATVKDGHVTGVSVGEATITAKAGSFTATCAVTVVEEVVPVQKKVINFTKVFFPVEFPAQYDVMDEVTMETWIKIAGASGNQSIMGVEGVFLLRTESNQWQLIYGGNVKDNEEYEEQKLATSYTDDLNKWTHVAAVYSKSANSVKLYVNGVEKGSGKVFDHGVNMNGITKSNGTKVAWKLPFTFIIGNACDGGRYLQGNVAYMRVWKKALSEAEIKAGLNNAAPSSSDVIANWKFDDAEGDSVKDSGPLGLTLAPKTYKDNGGSGATASQNIIDSTIEWIDGELPY